MWQRIEADPRIVEANEAWAVCMSEAGHEYADQGAMY